MGELINFFTHKRMRDEERLELIEDEEFTKNNGRYIGVLPIDMATDLRSRLLNVRKMQNEVDDLEETLEGCIIDYESRLQEALRVLSFKGGIEGTLLVDERGHVWVVPLDYY